MDERDQMRFPACAKAGTILRCTGRVMQPDRITVRVLEINQDLGEVRCVDLLTHAAVRLKLYDGGRLVDLNHWSFGRVEILQEADDPAHR